MINSTDCSSHGDKFIIFDLISTILKFALKWRLNDLCFFIHLSPK
ncbi:hypothetical protein AO375_1573 [Moraxella catarrhalis]|nr:hypothetical protein AO375_1573 [Moraxella catarrhalis]